MIETYNEGGLGMDEIDIAVLDMSPWEFKIECHDADKHKGDGELMHRGPTDATHLIVATCASCGHKGEEMYVCLNFIEEAYSERILNWKCPMPCKSMNRYSTTLTIIGCI
jgi:hypothetical protein